ncbi:MAG: cupin domain-containing protein [Hyphomonadaceae bacterium]|nr:cupin domain-containing protein [Hyphomonadaceae bacterium]
MMKVTSASMMDDASRAALASGRAEPSLGLFLDTLLAMRGISENEGAVIAGAALEAEVVATLSPNALDMAFAAIERGPAKPKAKLVYEDLNQTPAFLQDAILAAEARHTWRLAGPGIKRLPLGLPGHAKIEVIRIDAGTKVPWHTHKGQELTLCIAGEFSDSNGVYGPGDFSVYDGSFRHQPAASHDAPAYALAVTDAGLKFEGVLGALQKLFNV